MNRNPTEKTIRQDDAALRRWHHEVSVAASDFEARWTLQALSRFDATLAQRLREQVQLFDAAMVTGTAAEIEGHGAAMCRGYRKAADALAAAGLPDDSYLIGIDPGTGQRVAIGQQMAAAGRVREVYGDQVPFLSVDEVAALVGLASADAVGFAVAVKRTFPGAVVTKVRRLAGQGAQDGS